MAVPEAAVHEDSFLSPGEDDVRLARQILPVKSVPVPRCEQQTPYSPLRTRVLRLYCLHDASALGWSTCIHHLANVSVIVDQISWMSPEGRSKPAENLNGGVPASSFNTT